MRQWEKQLYVFLFANKIFAVLMRIHTKIETQREGELHASVISNKWHKEFILISNIQNTMVIIFFVASVHNFIKSKKIFHQLLLVRDRMQWVGNWNEMDDWILFYLSNMHLKLDVMMMTINFSRSRAELIISCI